jgi:Zn-dependent peptidase ImmA (M78 family)
MNIHVEGSTLTSLRKRYKASLEAAARMTSLEPDVLMDWETNGTDISITEAKRIAGAFHSHWSVLLLTSDIKPIKEPINHRAGYEENSHFSDSTIRAYEIARKILDASEDIEGQTLDVRLVPLMHLGQSNGDAVVLANRVRELMGISTERTMRIQGGPYEVYKLWRERVSGLGVYVSEQDMPADETKAFLLKDEDRAVIVINKKDRYIFSRVFSLLHELGHLIKGEDSAACLVAVSARRNSTDESWCNKFASELVASDAVIFHDVLVDEVRQSSDPSGIVKRLASKYKVSFTVMLYKLKRHDKISQEQCREIQAFFENVLLPRMFPPPDPEREIRLGRAYFVNKDLSRASVGLAKEVMAKNMAGAISYSEAAKLLGTKAKYLGDIKESVGFGR